jgi:fused signal recognition particle receptor
MARDLQTGLSKTRRSLKSRLSRWLGMKGKLPEEFWADWEAALIEVDLGVETTLELLEKVRPETEKAKDPSPEMVRDRLAEELTSRLSLNPRLLPPRPLPGSGPAVIMMTGVNGTGKTTTIAKLAKRLSADGSSVLLAACDTYRAAAIEQLQIWGERLSLEVIRQRYGGDPAAVAFDALSAALARKYDYLILDTAGRLHTRTSLMEELAKIVRVLDKIRESAPDEAYLCLDATFGRNALAQAKGFASVLPLTGVILTKLDGTARGGTVVSIQRELNLPVVALGVGETADDLVEFAAAAFVEALLRGPRE